MDRIEQVYLGNEEEEIHELLMDEEFVNEDSMQIMYAMSFTLKDLMEYKGGVPYSEEERESLLKK